MKFAPTGRYFAVIGDTDYIVYSYPKFQNTAFGNGTELAWSSHNSAQNHTYAVRLENGTVQVKRNFTDYKAFKTSFANEGIFGGRLLAIKSKDFITFYDWDEFNVVRRIDVTENIKNVYWSDDGANVILALESTFYMLTFHPEEFTKAMAAGELEDDEEEDGIEAAFQMVDEFPDKI